MGRSRRALLLAGALALACSSGAEAAKPVRRAVRRAVPVKVVEAPPTSTLNASGQMTPAEVMLRDPTAAETRANAVWSVRTALNVAAYQCGYSAFLNNVALYNANLAQHSEELDKARRTLVAHFKRHDPAHGDVDFDRYQTRISNSFSTLDAQYAFCEQASLVARNIVAIPKGMLGLVAPEQSASIRAALVPTSPLTFLGEVAVEPVEPKLDS